MGLKEDKVSAFVSAVQQAQTQVLSDQGGALYDGAFGDGVASVPAGTGGGDPTKIFSQADLDAAVASAQGLDAQTLSDMKAAAQAALDDMKAKLDEMTAKDQAAEGVVSDFQAKLKASQDAFNAVFAFVSGQPIPEPVPAPIPTPDPIPAPAPVDQPASLVKPKFDKKND